MKKVSTKKTSQDIPVLKREQLGTGIRGKYFQQYAHESNVVVLKPEILKVFPTSEAVNKALASMATSCSARWETDRRFHRKPHGFSSRVA